MWWSKQQRFSVITFNVTNYSQDIFLLLFLHTLTLVLFWLLKIKHVCTNLFSRESSHSLVYYKCQKTSVFFVLIRFSGCCTNKRLHKKVINGKPKQANTAPEAKVDICRPLVAIVKTDTHSVFQNANSFFFFPFFFYYSFK